MTGLALAMRAPDRVGRLVCCDARAFAPEPYQAIWDGNIASLHAEGIAGLVEPTIERWFTPVFRDAVRTADRMAMVRDMIRTTSPVGYEGVVRLLQTLNLQNGLAGLQVDTLYVTGEADMAAPVDVVQDMADRTPGGALKVLPNAAHLSNIEQPVAFIAAISAFLVLPD